MINKKPKVSIIIPVYNEESKIKGCLDSLFKQTYKYFEILIIDDDSTDKTLEIVRKYKVKIFRNGKKDYDIGKAIGIKNSKGKYLLFIDADNRLIDKEWLAKAVEVLENKPSAIGVESWKFFYSEQHSLANRYHDLFSNFDPAVFYIKSQDHIQAYEKSWNLKGKIIENNKDYIIVKFKKNEVPTIGSQGFLTRKIYFKDENVFQHIEFFIDLGGGNFCFLKNEVEHLAFSETKDLIKKAKRNIEHYISDTRKNRQERYSLNLAKMVYAFLIMVTLVKPSYDAIKGYIHIRDNAWFLHVFLSFIIPWIYAWQFIKFKLKPISFQA